MYSLHGLLCARAIIEPIWLKPLGARQAKPEDALNCGNLHSKRNISSNCKCSIVLTTAVEEISTNPRIFRYRMILCKFTKITRSKDATRGSALNSLSWISSRPAMIVAYTAYTVCNWHPCLEILRYVFLSAARSYYIGGGHRFLFQPVEKESSCQGCLKNPLYQNGSCCLGEITCSHSISSVAESVASWWILLRL